MQVASDPAGYLNNIKELTSSLASDPALLGQLVSSLPQTIKDEQELENPYSSDNALHASFAEGWYTGYTSGQLFVMWAGGEVVKSITSSEQFARISDSVLSKLDDAKAALKASETFGVTSKVGLLLADESGSVQPGTLIRVLEKVKYAADKAQVSKYYKVLSKDKQAALVGHEADVGELMSISPGDAANLFNTLDSDTLIQMLSLSSERLDAGLVKKLDGKLVKLSAQGVPTDTISTFIQNMDTLKNVKGIQKLANDVVLGGKGNFRGTAFEARLVAGKSSDELIELERGIISNSGDTIGEVDVVTRGNGQLIGYECKDRNFDTWKSFYNDMDKIKDINEKLLDPGRYGIPGGYKLDGYKVMFKQQISADAEQWLTSQNIPWEYYTG